MVVETFKNGDPIPVYRRFRDRGRLAPDGLSYVSSWVDANLQRCFQIMETDNHQLLDIWIAAWSDIVDFEVDGPPMQGITRSTQLSQPEAMCACFAPFSMKRKAASSMRVRIKPEDR